jgi:hypothetical protein
MRTGLAVPEKSLSFVLTLVLVLRWAGSVSRTCMTRDLALASKIGLAATALEPPSTVAALRDTGCLCAPFCTQPAFATHCSLDLETNFARNVWQ